VSPSKPTGSEKWPPSPFIDRSAPAAEMVTIDGIRIGRVVVPALENGDQARMQAFANTLQNYIEALARQNPQGWIVDLRGNLGGNMWPMLAGIAPLIDASVVGSFVDADGKKTTWFVDAEGSGLRNPDGSENVICRTAERKIGFREPQTIAVLIDRGTASSGEAIAIAFQGQPRVRLFGRATHGETTANEGFPLSDGANLVLATAVEADRTGKVYLSGITPDVQLPEEDERPKSTESDPMVRAAAQWIKLSATPNADEKR
jgi:C-terminal processing protease CtpA/Prc